MRARRPASLACAVVIERLNRSNVIPLALLASLLIGAGDFFTGVEVAFTLLYIFPIALGTWLRDRAFGHALAVLSAVLSGMAELGWRLGHHMHVHPYSLFLNHGGSLGIFILCVEVLGRLRSYVESARLSQKTAIEQLRHAERLNVVGKLAAGIAHELGTPLSVIATNAELVDAQKAPPETVHRCCRLIIDQAERIASIIRQLLDFGRRGGADRSATDLGAVVESTVRLLAPLARKRRVELEVSLPAEPIIASVNHLELGQVLSNLALNAVQAMPRGGRSLVELRRAEERGKPVAVLSVSDEGTGIRPEDVPRVFDPFFTTKGVGEGTGLGLSVAYGIVADHGGRVNVATEWGRGSRFDVILPLGT
ncbi:MAG TPA: ATP-binding protein [Polyangiaceae bacterium]|jgi:signal transduction histidine kinase|nr:ATP-binding protein [Polyangiaceae bacterium]